MYPSPHIAEKENKPFVSTSDFEANPGKVVFRGRDTVSDLCCLQCCKGKQRDDKRFRVIPMTQLSI